MSYGQLDMFAFARNTDPDTSHAAAASVKVALLERRVVACLREHEEGLNTKELCELTGIHVNSISPRMKPLEAKGIIRRTDERRGASIVWRAE